MNLNFNTFILLGVDYEKTHKPQDTLGFHHYPHTKRYFGYGYRHGLGISWLTMENCIPSHITPLSTY